MTKQKIKIFVSHRRNLNSELIPNRLYNNVMCGSALVSNHHGLLRDDDGDNISNKADNYGEFTVQYWAWKNQKADYYGLCHYRRYISFSDEQYPEYNEQRFYAENDISKDTCVKHNLLNAGSMARNISKYDIITSVTYNVQNIPSAPKFGNVYDAFVHSPALFTSAESVDYMKKIVKKDFPQYYDSLIEELKSQYHRGFNCFIMKHQLFDMMCAFQFGVLFKIEHKLDLKNRVGHYQRELGYLGEILYGTFIRWAGKQKYKIQERHIVLFLDTAKKNHKSRFYTSRILSKFWHNVEKCVIPNYKNVKKIKKQISTIHGGLAWQLIEMDKKLNLLSDNVQNIQKQNQLLMFSVPRQFPTDLKKSKLAFWASYPKATGDLRVVQLGNAALLKLFKQICDRLNVRFWLHGGSLIGALRHAGYVPWDDDIDIAMIRKDFLNVKKYLESDPEYTINEYYYFNLGCRSYRFQSKDDSLHCFVDIFIYDNYELHYGDELTDWQHLCYEKKRLIQELDTYCNDKNQFPASNNRLLEYSDLRQLCDKVFEHHIKSSQSQNENADFLLWGIDNNYENETRYAWHHGRIFKKDDIFPLKTINYEGMKLYMPNNYEKYAMAEYGISYWDMPNNFGSAIHFTEYFGQQSQIEQIRKFVIEHQGIARARKIDYSDKNDSDI